MASEAASDIQGSPAGDPCRLCGGRRLSHLVSFDGMGIERCASCRSAFVASPAARHSRQRADYSARYEQELDPCKARRCWELLGRWTNGLAGVGSLLDVGCGEGGLLDLARQAGLRTGGVEISPSAGKKVADKGHRLFHGSVDDGGILDGPPFDVVTMWDILEHLVRPARALETAHRMLRPGGRLVAVTPMVDSVFDRLAVTCHQIAGGGFRWLLRMCWSQDHLFRYHPAGVSRVLRRIGFTRVRVRPILLLSLRAEHYAGGKVMAPWAAMPRLNRAISRTGVFLVRRLGLCNKIVIQATKPREPRAGASACRG